MASFRPQTSESVDILPVPALTRTPYPAGAPVSPTVSIRPLRYANTQVATPGTLLASAPGLFLSEALTVDSIT